MSMSMVIEGQSDPSFGPYMDTFMKPLDDYGFKDVQQVVDFNDGYYRLLRSEAVMNYFQLAAERFNADLEAALAGERPVTYENALESAFLKIRADSIKAGLFQLMLFNFSYPTAGNERRVAMIRLGIDPDLDNLGISRVNYQEIDSLRKEDLDGIIDPILNHFGSFNFLTPYMLSERY